MSRIRCPICSSNDALIFLTEENVVAQQQFLIPTRREAQKCKRGDIKLGFCRKCGLVWNTVFDSTLLEYSVTYEATQMLSPAFWKYALDTAQYLTQKYDLHGRSILEIGCGDCSFLGLLVELGHNRGIGFDPSWRTDNNTDLPDTITVVPDYFSDRYANCQADLVCSRHVLEHVADPLAFLCDLGKLTESSHPIFFFEVPNLSWSIRNLAFWDIYYEHCLYFARPSLAYTFARCGFDILNLEEGFDGQYLTIESVLRSSGLDSPKLNVSSEVQELARDIETFSTIYQDMIKHVKRIVKSLIEREKIVLWGAGAKAVAFLNSLRISRNQIEFVVDINPRKWGAYVPGTAQEIVGPQFLREYKPDLILVMNPRYRLEVVNAVKEMGIASTIRALGMDDDMLKEVRSLRRS